MVLQASFNSYMALYERLCTVARRCIVHLICHAAALRPSGPPLHLQLMSQPSSAASMSSLVSKRCPIALDAFGLSG